MNATGKREKVKSGDLDKFISEQNIARYRKLLSPKTSEDQRRTILRLLEEESSQLCE